MDLSTTYMGLKLKNPLVPSASSLSKEVGNVKKLEDAGASAIILYSLFEEQLSLEVRELRHYLDQGAESFSEALSYFPRQDEYARGPEEYLEHIRKIKQAVSIPLIASLNCVSLGAWTEYAKKIQQAGADGIELNLYFIPTNMELTSEAIERLYVHVLREVKRAVSIPVGIKLSPYFTNLSKMMKDLDEAGADGIAVFNRFYQPDLNLEELTVEPGVVLSTSDDLRIALRWIAIMYGKIKASLAGTGGVHTAKDSLKLLMAGADITCLCAALLKNGTQHLQKILSDMEGWMEKKEYKSVAQLKGVLSQKSVAEPAAFERANYMKALNSYNSLPY